MNTVEAWQEAGGCVDLYRFTPDHDSFKVSHYSDTDVSTEETYSEPQARDLLGFLRDSGFKVGGELPKLN